MKLDEQIGIATRHKVESCSVRAKDEVAELNPLWSRGGVKVDKMNRQLDDSELKYFQSDNKRSRAKKESHDRVNSEDDTPPMRSPAINNIGWEDRRGQNTKSTTRGRLNAEDAEVAEWNIQVSHNSMT